MSDALKLINHYSDSAAVRGLDSFVFTLIVCSRYSAFRNHGRDFGRTLSVCCVGAPLERAADVVAKVVGAIDADQAVVAQCCWREGKNE